MPKPSHAAASGADPCRPSAASILVDEALHHLGTAADDADDAATRIRWLAGAARVEHGLGPDQWLSPAQCERLLRLATLADLLAAEARAMLAEVTPG
jgi:hypothetical protein